MFHKILEQIKFLATGDAEDSYLAVIAIDFGTTFSGYAFSMKSSKNNIMMNKNWGAGAGFQGYKTPTTILLQPDGSTHSFGFQAEKDFDDLDREEREKGYLLFQRFKMELFENKKLDLNTKLKSSIGETMPAVEIIAKSLEFMKKHAIDAISKTMASPFPEDRIRWVITVPAIWSDTAKKFMRIAAKEAGLVSDILSQNLIIALEPEAASMYCRTLALDKFVGMTDEKGALSIKAGERYIIVDCGGGTIDVTIHEAIRNGKVQEVSCASGGPWGGIFVDKNYYHILDEIFGADFMRKLKRDHPSTWISMQIDFETKKRAYPKNTPGINLEISHEFAKQFEKYSGEDVEDRIKLQQFHGVKFSNGMLRISGDALRNIYKDVLLNIQAHLKQLLQDTSCQSISKMFVVGGFAESEYLQEALFSGFGRDYKIFVPEEAGMCVMKGAVLFGHDIEYVSRRVARFNYGISMVLPFNESEHDSKRKIIHRGKARIKVLERLISKGQLLEVSHVVSTTCSFLVGQTYASIKLMSTDTDTDDPLDPSVNHVEEIIIENTNIEKQDRKITTSLKFGGTDILIKVLDHDTGKDVQSTIKF